MGAEAFTIDTVLKFLEIASIVGGGGLVLFRLGRTTSRVEATLERQNEILEGQSKSIDGLREETKQVNVVLTKIAVQESRLERIEEDIRDMQHGKGFVREPRDRSQQTP